MTLPPQTLRAIRTDRVFEIAWPNGPSARVPFRFLRGRCPCATCVDEFTNERKVDVADVPELIDVESMTMAGNYAVKITWSDQHDSGLYTWDHLVMLCNNTEWSDTDGT